MLRIFSEFASDPLCERFPTLKKYAEKLVEGQKFRVSKDALITMKDFFAGDESLFKQFLSSMVSNYYANNALRIDANEYLTQVNKVLLRETGSQIDSNGKYQKIIISEGCGRIAVNESVPPLVADYLYEAIVCLDKKLYRSSIVFCIFSIECALRIKYNLLKSKPSDGKKFYTLINWAIGQGLIQEDEFNRQNITFMRRYRNSLAHIDGGRFTDQYARESRENAERKSQTISRLTEFFINSIFP
jgi:hypothetical protein